MGFQVYFYFLGYAFIHCVIFPPKTHCWKQKWKLILINTFNLNKKPKSLRSVGGLVYLSNNKRMTKHGSELCPAKVLLISTICWCTSSEMSVPWNKSWGRHYSLLLLRVKLVCVYSLGCVSLHNPMDYSLPGCKWFKMNDSNAEKNSP